MGSGLDNAVLRIATTYNSRGMPELVTQYDAADLLRVEDTILTTADNDAFGRWDWLYTSDMVSRLKNAERGNWSGSAIDNDRATQNWTLTQTGNWDLWQSDEDGDGNFTDSGEFNDDRTHNDANEIIDRDTDDNGTANHAFTHDAAGNTTDDGQYEYEYDAWNRLTKVFNGGVGDWAGKKYRYNGLGWRITAINDTDADGSFDDETAEHYVYDSKWRIVARYDGSASTPKEQWCHHNAGLDGAGGSSYIDSVILRQRDATGDATLEERRYYCQNWRADVAVLLKESGVQVERVSYDPYGEAFGFAAGDTDFDGDYDAADSSAISGWSGAGKPYRAYADVDLDGDVDSADAAAAATRGLGRGVLSHSDNANRLGYAGYVHDGDLALLYHVRFRVLNTETGRWLQRDPITHQHAPNKYDYSAGQPISLTDPSGLTPITYEFNAFIDSRFGTQFPACGGGSYYQKEPGLVFGQWWFRTDSRMSGEPGTSRASTTGSVESTTLGFVYPDPPITRQGISERLDPLTCSRETAQGQPDMISYRTLSTCSTKVHFAAKATDPFIISPAPLYVEYSVTFEFTAVGPNSIQVTLTGKHGDYPSFEALVGGHLIYFWYTPHTWPSPAGFLGTTDIVPTILHLARPAPIGCGGALQPMLDPSQWVPGCYCLHSPMYPCACYQAG